LVVRKRGTQSFMQPGGKLEQHEDAAVALVRELREELGLVVDPSLPTYLGRFTAPAANEPGSAVEAELFRVAIADDVTPLAEIEEAIWIDPGAADDLVLAPLTRHHVLPLARSFCGS
jgi:8-oxo-dGTP diphosphatase